MIQEKLKNKKFRKFIEHIEIKPNSITGPWIAGGAVRKIWQNLDWTNGDVDIWCSCSEQFNNIVKTLTYHGKCIATTANAYTFSIRYRFKKINVQIINNTYDSIEDLFSVFDFNVCKFATDTRYIFTTESAILDCENNQLNLNQENVDINRLVKYCKYGFNPSHELVTKLIELSKIKQDLFASVPAPY